MGVDSERHFVWNFLITHEEEDEGVQGGEPPSKCKVIVSFYQCPADSNIQQSAGKLGDTARRSSFYDVFLNIFSYQQSIRHGLVFI